MSGINHRRYVYYPVIAACALLGTSLPTLGCGAGDALSAQGSNEFALTPAATNAWNQDVSTLPVSGRSRPMLDWLSRAGGFGTGKLRIDFSFHVLSADASTPRRTFTPTGDFFSPDCDQVPFPVPPTGALEGEDGYACTQGGDCHLLVKDHGSQTLYEMWRADIGNGYFSGGCAAVWHLDEAYTPSLRGENCTSADAGGFPIAPMLFSADEIAAGSINHAIRFILPNNRIQHGFYVHPATHSTNPASGSKEAPPYGARFRLRANYPLERLSPAARVVARALQRYGMLLADGGQIGLTAVSDRFTQHTWAEVGLASDSLVGIAVSDMEIVGMGTPVPYTADCVRTRQ